MLAFQQTIQLAFPTGTHRDRMKSEGSLIPNATRETSDSGYDPHQTGLRVQGEPMNPPPRISEWARKLIASEIDHDSNAAQTELATLRVYERLRLRFRAPVGVDAFQALASRALSVAKSQFPSLGAVCVASNGDLRVLDEIEAPPRLGEDGEVGVILISQMLRLFISLLGEPATVRLIEDAPLRIEPQADPETTGTNISKTGTNYLGPFKDISLEADQLRQVSERLETLTDTHTGIDELMSVAGNIRSIASVLDVFTLIRSKAGGSQDSVLVPPTNGYLN
ncbi:hypothetical protein ACPOL_3049 [Acidisarcina polymorpha]|uniref:Uncharacterized protein n=2 Tax=Acidisarcina polymorpha TaxID=2211140 RepID=A0A2Z5FZQ6_9BACT|nr:hypothetical protein ACPOL_3049 [Acidisarcina polymorpha]